MIFSFLCLLEPNTTYPTEKIQNFKKKFFFDFSTLKGYPTPPLYFCSGAEIEKTLWWPQKYSPTDFPYQISCLYYKWFGL